MATTAAAGVEFVFGLSAVILGIIALSIPYDYTLSLVAMLIIRHQRCYYRVGG